MADNITAPASGVLFATDDITGVHYPYTKLAFGLNGDATPVSASNPLPVVSALAAGAASAAKQDEIIVAIQGISPGGASGGDASAAKQDAQTALLTAIDTTLGGPLTVDGSGFTQPVSGTVGITGTVPVSGTFWPTTQPISGNVGVTGSVAVTGTFWPTTQPISGNVGVTGSVAVTGTFFPATQPVSATALPLPSGAATAANQSTLIGHVDTLEASLGAVGDASWSAGNGSVVALLKATVAAIRALNTREYEFVEAGVTDQMLGTTGAIGDVLNKLIITPLTTSPGAVSIEDGSTNTVLFAGGAASVQTLHPFEIDLGGLASINGGWEITTGANVRVTAVGNFT